MPGAKDPTKVLRKAAGALPDVVEAMSCNQTSYKAGKKAFLYVGPGTEGVGYKAMFKLEASLGEAESLAKSEPERYELGVGNWVTTRFSAEDPLPKNSGVVGSRNRTRGRRKVEGPGRRALARRRRSRGGRLEKDRDAVATAGVRGVPHHAA